MAHRILVVDDDEATRKGLKALLANAGYEVEEAAAQPRCEATAPGSLAAPESRPETARPSSPPWLRE